jgi:hypothetical protein
MTLEVHASMRKESPTELRIQLTYGHSMKIYSLAASIFLFLVIGCKCVESSEEVSKVIGQVTPILMPGDRISPG